MTAMLAGRGAEYIADWPHRIARQAAAEVEDVHITLASVYPGKAVGDLLPAEARIVANTVPYWARQRRIAAGERIEDVTVCRGCGLPLPTVHGECEECV